MCLGTLIKLLRIQIAFGYDHVKENYYKGSIVNDYIDVASNKIDEAAK
jgi:hypothetical protein